MLRIPMATLAAAIPVATAWASCRRPGAGRRGRTFFAARSSSSSSADDRKALFGRVAPVYDQIMDVFSLGQHRAWKRDCVSWAKRGDKVLDLCCGSGDLAFLVSEMVGLHGEVMAVDFSGQQLQTAARRAEQRWKPCYGNIRWIEGDALDLPFEDCDFDAVTMGYGLRNVVDKPKAMEEIFRVLKPEEELEKLAQDVGFSSAEHHDLAGGLMGNLVATRSS
ncbi:hypothetical protein BRADI_1g21164v3 [Brachypodium distachyon]|uniref:Menaquinone biosynthesis methyltransferase ubiE-like protein n=1 Tax=Brachypodium distachyon TaxID=15368 RepID=A0A2K2DKE4_BRADI|nr:hypothetical protein BRADI_1g21164v3 [Brachypodium distachyon]